MRILLVSRNRYLWQKLRLLRPSDEVTMADTPSDDYERIIWDADTAGGNAREDAIILSSAPDAELDTAFSPEELSAALGEAQGERITVNTATRTVTLDSERIRLTEVEFALLLKLYENIGSFVPRSELIYAVWGSEGNDSLINVYVHYLREKLERGSEKIIFSSRSLGYKLEVGKRR